MIIVIIYEDWEPYIRSLGLNYCARISGTISFKSLRLNDN